MTDSPTQRAPEIRVLRIITTVEPEVGGPSMSAVNAAVAEQSAGVTTTLVSTTSPTGGPYSPPALAAAGVRHHLFRRSRFLPEVGKRWGLSVPFARWILANARHHDVIHVHYVWSVGTLLGILSGVLWRRPVVMTPHESLTDFGIENSRSRLRRAQKRLVKLCLLAGLRRVIVASELELQDSRLPTRLGHVIPHPVPTTDGRTTTSHPASQIGFLGRLHEKKRVGDLLEAFSRLEGDARLLIGGAEPPEALASLRTHVREAGLADRVELLGFVAPSARDAMLARLDVLVMPSAYECFGMVAAEALSAGVPVIVTDRTGIASVVREFDAGLIVPVGSPRAIKAALVRLLDEPGRLPRMRDNARMAADARLSFDSYARSVRHAYDEVLRDATSR